MWVIVALVVLLLCWFCVWVFSPPHSISFILFASTILTAIVTFTWGSFWRRAMWFIAATLSFMLLVMVVSPHYSVSLTLFSSMILATIATLLQIPLFPILTPTGLQPSLQHLPADLLRNPGQLLPSEQAHIDTQFPTLARFRFKEFSAERAINEYHNNQIAYALALENVDQELSSVVSQKCQDEFKQLHARQTIKHFRRHHIGNGAVNILVPLTLVDWLQIFSSWYTIWEAQERKKHEGATAKKKFNVSYYQVGKAFMRYVVGRDELLDSKSGSVSDNNPEPESAIQSSPGGGIPVASPSSAANSDTASTSTPITTPSTWMDVHETFMKNVSTFCDHAGVTVDRFAMPAENISRLKAVAGAGKQEVQRLYQQVTGLETELKGCQRALAALQIRHTIESLVLELDPEAFKVRGNGPKWQDLWKQLWPDAKPNEINPFHALRTEHKGRYDPDAFDRKGLNLFKDMSIWIHKYSQQGHETGYKDFDPVTADIAKLMEPKNVDENGKVDWKKEVERYLTRAPVEELAAAGPKPYVESAKKTQKADRKAAKASMAGSPPPSEDDLWNAADLFPDAEGSSGSEEPSTNEEPAHTDEALAIEVHVEEPTVVGESSYVSLPAETGEPSAEGSS